MSHNPLDSQLLIDILNEINDAVYIINPETSAFLNANTQACLQLGYSHEELLHMRVIDIQTELPDAAAWRSMVKKAKVEKTFSVNGRDKRKDGSSFPVEVHGKYFTYNGTDYVLAVARDISERQDFANQLLEERNKLDAVLAAIGDGLTMMDTNFHVLYQNAVHQKKQGSHLGEYCYKAYQDKDHVCEGCLLQKTFKDGKIHRRETSAKTDKGIMHMEVSASPIMDAQGNLVGGIETVRDITVRKNFEQQLLQAQKMEAIGRLTGGIAHDFNNLLTIILGYSEIALGKLSKDDPLYNHLKDIQDAGGKASQLTRQLLAFSRKQNLEMKTINLNFLLDGMSKILQRVIGEDVELKIHLNAPTGNIVADETQINQIIMNLAVNARDAMPSGGILTIETTEIELDEDFVKRYEGLKAGRYVQLTMTDTGCGISMDVQKKIFDPFFTTKESGKGTGLGLSTVYGIVKQHNGQIVIYSEPQKGSTFKAFFPIAQDKVTVKSVPRTLAAHGTETILVVDDEPDICSLIALTLQPLGYAIFTAHSAEEAIKLYKNSDHKIDLLLTDVIMSKMNGRKLADSMNSVRPGLRVLYMSGYTENVIADRGIIKPHMNYLTKPIVREQLAYKIREILDLESD